MGWSEGPLKATRHDRFGRRSLLETDWRSITAVPGPVHHRSMFTFIGASGAASEAAFPVMWVAGERIDLNKRAHASPACAFVSRGQRPGTGSGYGALDGQPPKIHTCVRPGDLIRSSHGAG